MFGHLLNDRRAFSLLYIIENMWGFDYLEIIYCYLKIAIQAKDLGEENSGRGNAVVSAKLYLGHLISSVLPRAAW